MSGRLSVLACGLLLVLSATAAQADTITIGNSLTNGTGTGTPTSLSCGTDCTAFQAAQPGATLTSPVDGTITSWSYRSAINGSVVALRVLHPSGSAFTGAGTSDPQATPSDGQDVVRGPFAVNIPIHAGDQIGLRDLNAMGIPIFVSGSSGDKAGFFSPALGDGQTRTPTVSGSGQQVLVQATIQPNTSLPSCGSPPAPPTDILIDFECIQAGTQLQNQYASFGVTFGSFVKFTGQYGLYPKVLQLGGGQAQSGSHVADLNGVPCGREFCTNAVYGQFAVRHKHVQVYVGEYGPPSESASLTLTTYDLNGNELRTVQATVRGGAGIHTKLALDDPSQRIAFFSVDAPPAQQDTHVAMDDLSFDNPAPSTLKPDFALVRDAGFTNSVLIHQGHGAASPPIIVSRIDGSSGPINFLVTGLPAGVHASLAPGSLTGAGGGTVAVSFTADANAPPATDAPVTITGRPGSPQVGPNPRNVTIFLTVQTFATFDLQITGIEVTQGVQTTFAPGVELPARSASDPFAPVPYSGVKLASFHRTVVRVFANARRGPDGGVPRVEARLYISYPDTGRDYRGNPLYSIEGPQTVPQGVLPYVTQRDRAGESSASWTFNISTPPLPEPDEARTLNFRAELVPEINDPRGSLVQCSDSPDCGRRNTFTLTGVRFRPESTVNIVPTKMFAGSLADPPPADQVYAKVQQITPRTLDVFSPQYAETINVNDIINNDTDDPRSELSADLLDELDDNAPGVDNPSEYAVGVGSSDNSVTSGTLYTDNAPESYVEWTRPFTAVAHEMGHSLGLSHASAACGGQAGGNFAESWPPDEFGYINGAGLDFSQKGPGKMPYKPIVGGVLGASPCGSNTPPDCGGPNPAFAFDIMSYCAQDGIAWISPKNWDREFDYGNPNATKAPDRTPLVTRVRGPNLRVAAVVSAGGVEITHVEHNSARTTPAINSTFSLQLIGRAGRPAGAFALGLRAIHIDHATGGGALIQAVVPDPGNLAGVQILQNGVVVATKMRPPHAPSVRIISPRRGARLGAGRNVHLLWKATDQDHQALTVKVDYSADDGRHWRQIFASANANGAVLPSSYFTGSPRGRVRVRVNDGFNETSVVSGRFRAIGTPPVVDINTPASGQSFAQDATVVLTGQAWNDTPTHLRGRALTWLQGRRKLGTGESISVTQLPAGIRTITLVGRDSHGRMSRTSVRIRVLAVPAFATFLKIPSRIGRQAHRLVIVIATNVPARLRIGRQIFIVGPKRRRVTITIRPGRNTLTLPLVLRSGPFVNSPTISIRRR